MHISQLNLTWAVYFICAFLDRATTMRARESSNSIRAFSQLQHPLQQVSLATSLLSTTVTWEGASGEAALQPHYFISTERWEPQWLCWEGQWDRGPPAPAAVLGGGSLFQHLSIAWEHAVQLDFSGISVPSSPSPQIPMIYTISSCVIPLIL